MNGNGKTSKGGDVLTTVLFWISMPLAFGLGMWCSYMLMQQNGKNDTRLTRARETIAQLRQSRLQIEQRLQKATERASGLREKLSSAKNRIKQLKADKKQNGGETDDAEKRLRRMRKQMKELKKANKKLQQRLTEVTEQQGTERESADSPGEPGAADRRKAALPGLDIISANAEVTERNDTFWQYSWKVELENNGSEPLQLMGQVLFNSSDGSRVNGSPLEVRLGPGENKTVTGDCLIRSAKAEDVEQLSVTISEMPEENSR